MNEALLEKAIDGTTYYLRRRLGWFDQKRIDDAAFVMMVNGQQLSQVDNIAQLENVQVVLDSARQTQLRLRHRLCTEKGKMFSTPEINDIPGPHVTLLNEAIEQLESDEAEEVKTLRGEDPTQAALNG